MKKIAMNKIKKELNNYNVDDTAKELVLNNISLFNDLVDTYNGGEKKHSYLMYQLNAQIFKMILQLQKGKDATESKEADNTFLTMVETIKKNKLEKRG
jgi:hypothetical protein